MLVLLLRLFCPKHGINFNFFPFRVCDNHIYGPATHENTYMNASLSALIFNALNAAKSFKIFGGFWYLVKIKYRGHS